MCTGPETREQAWHLSPVWWPLGPIASISSYRTAGQTYVLYFKRMPACFEYILLWAVKDSCECLCNIILCTSSPSIGHYWVRTCIHFFSGAPFLALGVSTQTEYAHKQSAYTLHLYKYVFPTKSVELLFSLFCLIMCIIIIVGGGVLLRIIAYHVRFLELWPQLPSTSTSGNPE